MLVMQVHCVYYFVGNRVHVDVRRCMHGTTFHIHVHVLLFIHCAVINMATIHVISNDYHVIMLFSCQNHVQPLKS